MSSLNIQNHALNLAAGLSRLQAPADAVTVRISSGQRLDRPSRDVAGSGLAAKLDSQQARLEAVEVNLQNGVSRMQVTSNHLDTLARVVTRLGEIATLGRNAVQSEIERSLYAEETTQLLGQLRQTIGGTSAQIGGKTDVTNPLGEFDGAELFGSGPADTLAIGLQTDEQLTLPVLDFRSGPLAALFHQDAAGAFTFDPDAPGATNALDAALDQIAEAQARVGSVQSRLEFAAGVATTARTNQEAALSVIRDADIAAETTNQARLQILSESHTAMLAQARDATAKLLPLLSRN